MQGVGMETWGFVEDDQTPCKAPLFGKLLQVPAVMSQTPENNSI